MCLHPWPCQLARQGLLAERNGRTWLHIYLAGQLAAACHDLPAASPAALYRRFLRWVP